MNKQNKKQIETKKLGFIGGGNMAQALISGLLKSDIPAEDIMVCDPNAGAREYLQKQGVQTTTDAQTLIEFAEVVIFAIKPQLFSTVLSPLSGMFSNKLIISVAAGISVNKIIELTGNNCIVRAMPNTPALIQTGATGLYASHHVSEAHKQIAEMILGAAGVVIWVDSEEKIHAVTAVSGSAPAYFFYIMEIMIKAGKDLGLTEAQAKQLTLQTALGAAKMALSSDDSPTTLREKVTSPNGTTHAAIESMKESELEATFVRAMQACVARSEEMAKM